MALPIAPTPILNGKEAEEFLEKVAREEGVPSYPKADPDRLEEVRQRIIRDILRKGRT